VVTADPRYQRLVDGFLLPAPVAGEPVLDFCNTRAGWGEPEPREYLATYGHLVVWTREAGLLDDRVASRLQRAAKGDERGARRVLDRALRLRSAVYAASTDPGASAAWNTVTDEARAAAKIAVLDPHAPPGARWKLAEDAGLALPVTNPWLFFADYAVELSDADTERVGAADPDVWVTVRTGTSPQDFSANLRAPIVIADGRGHQVINEASDAPVRAPLFAGDVVEAAA
jgi:flagellar assembly factor FliW